MFCWVGLWYCGVLLFVVGIWGCCGCLIWFAVDVDVFALGNCVVGVCFVCFNIVCVFGVGSLRDWLVFVCCLLFVFGL